MVTKQISYELRLDVRINETDLKLLRFLDLTVKKAGGPVTLTARSVSRGLGKSEATVRRSIKILSTKGLVVIRDSLRSDGGREANTYRLTDLGEKLLDVDALQRRTQRKR